MLQEVDQSIKNLLLAELRANSDGLVHDENQIVFGLPADDEAKASDTPKIHLFLHDVHENLALRDQSFEIKRGSDEWEVGKSRRPVKLNLSYLLTVRGKDSATEHRLLGEALGVLMRNGFVPSKYLVGSLVPFGEEAILLSVAQKDHWAHGDGAKIWQATGHPLRPFIGLVAAAMFDPFETKTVRLVREALIALGQSTHPEGPDRQMGVRSVRVSAGGTVADAAGNPLVDVTVSIKGREEEAITDENGVFFFRNLPAGPHELEFRKRGLEGVSASVIAPVRGLANELQPVAIQMRDASDPKRAEAAKAEFVDVGEATRLVGTLRYADGRAASFVPVRIGERTAVTDENGMYHFTDLPAGSKELVAEIAGMGEKTLPVKPGATTIELPKK